MLQAPVNTVPDRHQRMRDAARELWLEHGYRTSMDAVARRAGCSKQTVYAHFGSKEGLFRCVVEDLIAPVMANLDMRAGDLRASLQAFAQAHAEQLGSAESVARRRILISEAPRFPNEANALWRGGLEAIRKRLGVVIAAAMRRGELRKDNADVAAEIFLGLNNGIELERLFFGPSSRATRSRRKRWADQAVTYFLRLYSAAPPH